VVLGFEHSLTLARKALLPLEPFSRPFSSLVIVIILIDFYVIQSDKYQPCPEAKTLYKTTGLDSKGFNHHEEKGHVKGMGKVLLYIG
jgi:hypothetical protein